jgi:drug/metabolite transporter (DMT)-like permease
MAAVLIAVQPLFAAVIGTFWLGERLTLWRGAGLLLGLVGVAVLVGWSPVALDRSGLLCIAASLLASACYAVGTIYARHRLADAPVLTLALGQQLGAAAWLAVPALVALPEARVTVAALGALLCLALLCTALAYLAVLLAVGAGRPGAGRHGDLRHPRLRGAVGDPAAG